MFLFVCYLSPSSYPEALQLQRPEVNMCVFSIRPVQRNTLKKVLELHQHFPECCLARRVTAGWKSSGASRSHSQALSCGSSSTLGLWVPLSKFTWLFLNLASLLKLDCELLSGKSFISSLYSELQYRLQLWSVLHNACIFMGRGWIHPHITHE